MILIFSTLRLISPLENRSGQVIFPRKSALEHVSKEEKKSLIDSFSLSRFSFPLIFPLAMLL